MLYKRFQAEAARYDERIAELRNELTLVEEELREARRDREIILRDVMSSGDLSEIESRISTAQKHAEHLQTRIRYAEAGKVEALASLLPDVELERLKAEASAKATYDAQIREHNWQKIVFLESAKRIGDIVREINVINSGADGCRTAAGKERTTRPFNDRMTLSEDWTYFGKDASSHNTLSCPRWIVEDALAGSLPAWRSEVMPNEK